jgi:hypothetical protein
MAKRMFTRLVALPAVGVVFALMAGAAVGVFSQQRAAAQAERPLDAFRDRLESFNTVFVRFTLPPSRSVGSGAQGPTGVLRMDRATGRVAMDLGVRVLWDGEHLWSDDSDTSDAVRFGDEADGMMAELMDELLSGLSGSTFYSPLSEDWGPGNEGTRVDLPFDWDDEFAVLLASDRVGNVNRVTVVRRDTLAPAVFFGRWLRQVPLEFQWNVRLFADLGKAESIGSRTYLVSDDGWTQKWGGPPFLPGWHEETTRNPLVFDTAASSGWVLPTTGEEVPQTRLSTVACTAAGQTTSLAIQLSYGVEDIDPSYGYLPDAITAGCPLRADLGLVRDHQPVSGTKTRVQVAVRLLDVSVGPYVTLAQSSLDEEVTGPAIGRRGKDIQLMTTSTSVTDADSLELEVVGSVRVACLAATPGKTTGVAFGIDSDKPPVLSWPDCYPEIGAVP